MGGAYQIILPIAVIEFKARFQQAVVQWESARSWARIARFDGMKAVTLRGDVDTRLLNTNELMSLFRSTYFHEFSKAYPDLKLSIAGSLEETNTTRKSMLSAMLIGFIGIFILLSFQFKTYTQPLIVMLAIPCLYLILGDLGLVQKIGSESE